MKLSLCYYSYIYSIYVPKWHAELMLSISSDLSLMRPYIWTENDRCNELLSFEWAILSEGPYSSNCQILLSCSHANGWKMLTSSFDWEVLALFNDAVSNAEGYKALNEARTRWGITTVGTVPTRKKILERTCNAHFPPKFSVSIMRWIKIRKIHKSVIIFTVCILLRVPNLYGPVRPKHLAGK
jgi:hypothetical protein